jgi:polysaccharide pyruvyl transferase WcaK-like protein
MRMDGVTVRDEGAKRVLEEVGVDRPVAVTGDPAMLLEPEPFTDDMLRMEGIDRESPLVGLSVRERGSAAPGLETEDYHNLLAEAADFIVHRYEAGVVFVPMERGDIRHSHAVISRMLAADRAQVLKGDYNPRQVLGLMEHFAFVVGMRLHFLIFAAISAVPFLPLPYAGKVSDFVAAAGVPAPPGVTRESAGPLLAEIDKLWDARDDHRRHLARTVPGLQEHARRTGRLAAELLASR